MRRHFFLSSVLITLLLLFLPFKLEAQSKKVAFNKDELVDNGVILAEKFGLKPGETKAKQTKALQAIVDLYADNVPNNSWDINPKNPEPTIVIPAGEYNVGEIELRSYVTIKGAGRGSTVLRGVTFKADKQYNITIEDLSIVGFVGTTKESRYDLENKRHSSAFLLNDCARLIFKNVCIKNYDVAFDNYNTYMVDLYSCFISYCNVCYMNDGKGNGYGGHAIHWYGGEMCDAVYGFVQKCGNTIQINGATIEGCRYGVYLINPASFTISSCGFEANNYDIYGTITHVNIENNTFSKSGKKKGDVFIFASTAIGFAVIQGNSFDLPLDDTPHIMVDDKALVYSNIMIGQNDIVHGGRIPISERLLPFVIEKGVNTFQTYLPNGKEMLMGQTIVYKNPISGKYYLVTRDIEGKLLFLPFSYEQ